MLYLLDLSVLALTGGYFLAAEIDILSFIVFNFSSWILISLQLDFYQINRLSKLSDVNKKLLKQALLFSLLNIAFFLYYYEFSAFPTNLWWFIIFTVLLFAFFKIVIFFAFKHYRRVLGGNYRKVVILGSSPNASQLEQFFTNNPGYGFRLMKTFRVSEKNSLTSIKKYIYEESIDEIYCMMEVIDQDQLQEIVDFADNNLRTVKLVPSVDRESNRENCDLYGDVPVRSLRSIPLHDPANRLLKRSFDLVFSLFVIVFILAWLTPLLALLIKLESRGPVFFIQERNGLDYKVFNCYKFRSMVLNPVADLHQVTRGDKRITGIGKFLRKTSIDELPQFINVFLGHMSVVGPRPHMVSHTEMYASRVDKFMVRHFVKPGITGLAQARGYRGEVETEEDILGRVQNDLLYIENWSMSLDFHIVLRTILNVFVGEEKAY